MNNNKKLIEKFGEAQYGAMRTSFLTAFPKIFTDIDFSIEIFSKMKNLATKKGFAFLPSMFSNEMSIEIEARHKSLNKALQQNLTKDTLIIEIAAGLSPRRLQFKEYKYAELDISPVIDVKKEIYKTMDLVELTKSLYGTDVTNTDELNKNLNKILKDKNYNKVIVLIEGLFWYLTRNEIENMTKQFIKALKGKDWMLITSDCPPYQKFEADFRNVISGSAKVKKGKTFADYEDFSLFFKNLGLTNKNYKLSHFVKYNNLSSAKFFNVKEEDAIERIEKYTDVAILKN